jgi:TonB family protein
MIATRLILSIYCIFIASLHATAQELTTLYYNESWQLTIKREAIYKRQAAVKFRGDSLIWDGEFTDRTMDDRILREGAYRNNVKQGLFKFYHENGVLESTGEYLNGQRAGEWRYYNDHGGTKQVVVFEGREFSVLEFFDTRDKQLVSEGTGNWKLFVPFGDRVVSLDAYFTSGKRSGKWVYRYSPGGKILMEEYDDTGNLIEGVDYEKKGNPTYLKTKLTAGLFEVPSVLSAERLFTDDHFYGPDAIRYVRGIVPKTVEHTGLKPSYRDGIEEFYNYVLQNYRYPESAFNERLEGQVIIDFLIDAQGNTLDFRVMRGISQELNAEAVRLISSTDGWIPADDQGQPVSSRMSVPITFKVN